MDLLSTDLDDSHIIYLGNKRSSLSRKKKRNTANTLYLSDQQGLSIAMSEPVSGNHNDLFEIKVHFK